MYLGENWIIKLYKVDSIHNFWPTNSVISQVSWKKGVSFIFCSTFRAHKRSTAVYNYEIFKFEIEYWMYLYCMSWKQVPLVKYTIYDIDVNKICKC